MADDIPEMAGHPMGVQLTFTLNILLLVLVAVRVARSVVSGDG